MPSLNIRLDNKEWIRTLLLTEGFGFCFSLSCVLGYRLDSFGTVCLNALDVFENLFRAFFLCQPIVALFFAIIYKIRTLQSITETSQIASEDLTDDIRLASNNDSSVISVRIWLISSLALIVLWLPIFLAYYPGVFSYYAEAQIYQIISGPYSTHHPLLHTLFVGACVKSMYDLCGMMGAVALYSCIQLIAMAGIFGWVSAELWRVTSSRMRSIIWVLFVGIFPVHGILAISTTKDVLFSGVLLIYILLIRREVCEKYVEYGKDEVKGTKLALLGASGNIKLIVVSALLVLLRNNSSYMIGLTVVVFLFTGIKIKQIRSLTAVLAAGLVVGLVLSSGLSFALHAESGSPREMLSIPIQQMARVGVLHGDELTIDEAEALAKIMNDDALSHYDEHLADPVKERVNISEPVHFVKTWIKFGLHYLGDYVDAWLLTTEGAWYIRDTSVNRIYGEGSETGFGYLSTDIRNMPPGFEVQYAPVLPGLHAFLERLVSDNSFEHIPVVRGLFSPALYFWLLVLFIYWCILRRRGQFILTVVPLLTLFLTVLMGPAILVRYMYPYMLAIVIPLIFVGVKDDYS